MDKLKLIWGYELFKRSYRRSYRKSYKRSYRGFLVAGLMISALCAFSKPAQAREIYWTGTASVYAGYQNSGSACDDKAYLQAHEGARYSCYRDYGIQWEVCQRAPVSRVEYLESYYSGYETLSCSVRVYISVP